MLKDLDLPTISITGIPNAMTKANLVFVFVATKKIDRERAVGKVVSFLRAKKSSNESLMSLLRSFLTTLSLQKVHH